MNQRALWNDHFSQDQADHDETDIHPDDIIAKYENDQSEIDFYEGDN